MTTLNPYAPPTATDSFQPQFQAPAQAGEPTLARLSDRFFGALLDGLFIMIAAFLGGLSAAAGEPVVSALITGGMVVLLLVCQCYLISTTGQSLGKRVVGTRIVRDDGRPAGFVHGVLLRAVPTGVLSAVPFVGYLVQLTDALMVLGSEHKCLHDHIAGTKVIKA